MFVCVRLTWALTSEHKNDQGDFTDWMSFLPSTFMEETSPEARIQKPSVQILKAFHQHGKPEETII